MLNGTLLDQLGGKVGMTWAPTGLVCEIAVPLTRSRNIGFETPLPEPLPNPKPGPVAAASPGPALGR
ncbi:hypothetical protein ACFQS7_08200 [Dankookia sp. GCM10030260]|uniref:hypothetical protein n=1 Tax=Dankookia sp. GCM10030260 TaxID=3273390 RepID=UPI00361782DA